MLNLVELSICALLRSYLSILWPGRESINFRCVSIVSILITITSSNCFHSIIATVVETTNIIFYILTNLNECSSEWFSSRNCVNKRSAKVDRLRMSAKGLTQGTSSKVRTSCMDRLYKNSWRVHTRSKYELSPTQLRQELNISVQLTPNLFPRPMST